jgi:hypothetical protein
LIGIGHERKSKKVCSVQAMREVLKYSFAVYADSTITVVHVWLVQKERNWKIQAQQTLGVFVSAARVSALEPSGGDKN